jgi:hypothetical protein
MTRSATTRDRVGDTMDTVHFCSKDEALCGALDARWCTILRDAVTCAECRRRLAQRERSSDDEESAAKSAP